MRSIFRKRNPDVEALFEKAESASKVMCVAFDYAKKVHTSVVCDGTGRQLHGVFNVENNRLGLDYLLGIVSGLCRKHKIQREHVFFMPWSRVPSLSWGSTPSRPRMSAKTVKQVRT